MHMVQVQKISEIFFGDRLDDRCHTDVRLSNNSVIGSKFEERVSVLTSHRASDRFAIVVFQDVIALSR